MPDTVILGRELIDGTGRDPVPRPALIVREGRIAAIEAPRRLGATAYGGAHVVDLGECALVPGLIDSHVHLNFSAGPDHETVRGTLEAESDAELMARSLGNAQAHLRCGVTTVRDCGGRGLATLAVRDAIRAGVVVGPRVLAAGPAITTTTGHLNYLRGVANTESEVRQMAASLLAQGVDYVKICATGGIMTRESDPLAPQYAVGALRAAVEEAERRGTHVAAHILSTEGLQRCVEAGTHTLEHCQMRDAAGEYVYEPALTEQIRERGLTASLSFAAVSQTGYWAWREKRPVPPELQIWHERMKHAFEAQRQMIAAGVRYMVHTDAGVRGTPFGHYWSCLGAMRLELQLTPMEVLIATTRTPAEVIGLGAEIGTLEVGKRADLVAVPGDPLAEIEALANIRAVLRDGVVVHAAV
jgi:imidazolonepropionase-like amidohydrolase